MLTTRSIVGGCTVRVQRAHDEHAHLGGRHRDAHRLEVAELADEDRVGVLAQGGVQGVREARAVNADLALAHEAQLALVHELDRVLDREDVALELGVDRVDDGGERRRLARAGLAGDENEAARRRRELVQRLRHLELVERQAFDGMPRNTAPTPFRCRNTLTRNRATSGIECAKSAESCLLNCSIDCSRHDAEQLGLELLGVEALVVERDQVAVHAHARRVARDHVEVGALAHVHAAQKVVDQRHRRLRSARRSRLRSAARSCR